MKNRSIFAVAVVAATSFYIGNAGAQGNILTGDTRYACEAIMCLATSKRPHECNPSLQRYFGINRKKPGDTVRDRIAFLNQCPAGNQTPQMQSFVTALANGAGRCDAASVNQVNQIGFFGEANGASRPYITDVLPDYCAVYVNHSYTGGTMTLPRYVGVPARGGYWVEASQYEQALRDYNVRIQKEDYDQLMGGTWPR